MKQLFTFILITVFTLNTFATTGPSCTNLWAVKKTGWLTKEQLRAVELAIDNYSIRILEKKSGQVSKDLVVLVGETHIKDRESSEIGKTLLEEFRVRGLENIKLKPSSIFIAIAAVAFAIPIIIWGLLFRVKGSTIHDAKRTKANVDGVKVEPISIDLEKRKPTDFDPTIAMARIHIGLTSTCLAGAIGCAIAGQWEAFYPLLGIWFADYAASGILEVQAKKHLEKRGQLFYDLLFHRWFGLIEGRDDIMARNIVERPKRTLDEPLLVIVGAAHIPGIEQRLINLYGYHLVYRSDSALDRVVSDNF